MIGPADGFTEKDAKQIKEKISQLGEIHVLMDKQMRPIIAQILELAKDKKDPKKLKTELSRILQNMADISAAVERLKTAK